MTKKCSVCGFENADDAKFCSSCGHSFDVSKTGNQAPNQVIDQKSRLSRSFDLFTKNLAIVIPAIVLLILEIILTIVSGLFTSTIFGFSGYSAASITTDLTLIRVIGLVISIIMAVIYFLTLHATMYGVREVVHNRQVTIDSTFKNAIPTFHDLFLPLIIIVVIAAVVGYFVPYDLFLSFLIVGILSLPVYIMSASMILGKSKGFSESFSWFMELFNKDGTSALVMLLGALFSLIPVLNIFAIPYTAELTYISVDEIAAPSNK